MGGVPRLVILPSSGIDPDHLLERDDIGIDFAQHLDDALRADLSVQAAAFVHIVGSHANMTAVVTGFRL